MGRSVVAVMLGIALAATAGAASSVTLTFAPRDGGKFTQRLTTRTLIRIPVDQARRETVQESVTDLRWERAGKRWRLIGVPRSARHVRDGVEVSDPVGTAMVGRELVYTVGPDAEVESFTGLDAVVQAVLDSLPPEGRALMKQTLNVEAMTQRELHDFEARVTEWAGATVEDGLVIAHQDVAPLPTGALVMHARTRIGPIVRSKERTLVTLRTVSDTDSAAVPALLNAVQAGTFRAADLDTIPFGGPRVIQVIERTLDASTLDIVSESSERMMHLLVKVPGTDDRQAFRSEQRTWRFEYAGGRR